MYLIQIDNPGSFPSVFKHFDRPLNLRLLKCYCNPRDNGSSTAVLLNERYNKLIFFSYRLQVLLDTQSTV